MKVYVILILTLIKLGASEVDEELQEKFMTLSRSNFVEHFNEKNYSWKIKKYTDTVFNWDLTNSYEDYQRYHKTLQSKYHNPSEVGPLPENFDARIRWPQCPTIREIYYQYCESCWAHSTANTASDRTCIHTNEVVYLSEQDLECQHVNRTVCDGGFAENGFNFWKEKGLVTRQCKPYPPWIKRRVCVESCVSPFQSYTRDKHYAREVYSVPNIDYQIRAEIFLNGPISATFNVCEDFQSENYSYHSGIYVHTHGNCSKRHAVRVIGYGVENGYPYWLAANSWSYYWGEQGLFRILRFQKNVDFEDCMFAGLPVTNW